MKRGGKSLWPLLNFLVVVGIGAFRTCSCAVSSQWNGGTLRPSSTLSEIVACSSRVQVHPETGPPSLQSCASGEAVRRPLEAHFDAHEGIRGGGGFQGRLQHSLRGGGDVVQEDDVESEEVELRESEEEALRLEAEEAMKEGTEEYDARLEQDLIEAAEAEDADPDTLRELADYLQSKGRDLDQARELYQRCLERNQYNLRANCNLGRLLHEAGDFDAAEEHYLRALKKEPADVDTLSYYGVFLHSVRKVLPAAAAVYKRVLEYRPDDADCHSNYGTLLLEMLGPTGALDAERHLKRALELRPDDTNALYNYAVLLQELRGDWKNAERTLERVLELDPDDLAATYNYAVMQLEVEEDFERAEQLCQKVLRAAPDDVDALYVYGDLLAFKRPEGERDFEAAAKVYQRVLEIEPEHTDVLINYGIMLLQARRDIPAALAMFKRAALLKPDQIVGDSEGRSTTITELCRELVQLMVDLEGEPPGKLARMLDPARWVTKGAQGPYNTDTIAKRFEEFQKSAVGEGDGAVST
mmetsp:Transcript_1520/g.3140  ORF Transcript_1520/g.3140 Transcript_1520/m.3140 type:complete len:527 (-) Transcript_1520:49-1629(-)|eukprot:CAMPEP_0181320134 /NCGR_PEP_ID=MMETSP1101-20121128/17955_1 /TAXON_ID=46948 /ORGANISM="Rhodomonas abbreviata, Strain Caron Lab Isolate" /LENGTH=526 /DNA_ID=CAMNT_0023427805 /DNA_START=195 /DNA_END=1775 /DNA_ORIENTATION=-